MHRRFALLAALAFSLLSSVQLLAQSPASVTLVKAGRLLDPRTGNVLSPVVVPPEADIARWPNGIFAPGYCWR